MPFWRQTHKSWEKAAGAGPVTEADLAVDEMLKDRLLAARPTFGWLSEETDDDPSRLDKDWVFIVDPIDGTRSFMAGERTWAHSLAVAHRGKITAAVVWLPAQDKLYTAALGAGAQLNGQPIRSSHQANIQDATVLATRPNFDPEHWPQGVPPVHRHFRASLAYRLTLVAEGRFDAMLTFRNTWEWGRGRGRPDCARSRWRRHRSLRQHSGLQRPHRNSARFHCGRCMHTQRIAEISDERGQVALGFRANT